MACCLGLLLFVGEKWPRSTFLDASFYVFTLTLIWATYVETTIKNAFVYGFVSDLVQLNICLQWRGVFQRPNMYAIYNNSWKINGAIFCIEFLSGAGRLWWKDLKTLCRAFCCVWWLWNWSKTRVKVVGEPPTHIITILIFLFIHHSPKSPFCPASLKNYCFAEINDPQSDNDKTSELVFLVVSFLFSISLLHFLSKVYAPTRQIAVLTVDKWAH